MKLLSSIWTGIQSSLFPFLEEEVGPMTEKQRKLVSTLELIRIEDSISYTYKTGRPLSNRKAIARAFVAKAVYNCTTTRELLDRLKCDKVLRRICGWELWSQIPNESTFSRAFAEFAESRLPEEVHEALIKKQTLEEMLADLPTVCDRGTKKNSKGYKESWNGYKLHIDIADGQIPITPLLTSASLHDSQPAIPLATMTSKVMAHLMFGILALTADQLLKFVQ